MFERDEEGNLAAMHHPFTSPKDFSPEQLRLIQQVRGQCLRYGHQRLRSGWWFLCVRSENATNCVPYFVGIDVLLTTARNSVSY